MQKKDL